MDLKATKLIAFLGFIISGVLPLEWEYAGQKGIQQWACIAHTCGKTSQSPIDFKTSNVLPDSQLGALRLGGYDQLLSGGQFVNNGHTIQLNLPKDKQFKLSGKGIHGNYSALQLHFHWPKRDASVGGSEHTVNGHHYDAEMHIVHIKNNYTSLDEVKDMDDGLAVIGVFLNAHETLQNNSDFQLLLDVFKKCHYKGDSYELNDGPSLVSLLPSSGSYYRYYGSLTTPPCYEAVLWTVYQQPLAISKYQLQVFQSLTLQDAPVVPEPENASNEITEGTPPQQTIGEQPNLNIGNEEELGDNYRPTQSLHGRMVTAYYDVGVQQQVAVKELEWHYGKSRGAHTWSNDFPTCKGRKQSPINFNTKQISASSDLKNLKFSSSYKEKTSGEIKNNGHTVKYSLNDNKKLDFWETENRYQAAQLHFHWAKAGHNGKDLTFVGGSEHTVDGKHFPIEMHIVHLKEKQEDEDDEDDHDEEEKSVEDNYGVLGVFLAIENDQHKSSKKANEALQKLTEAFDGVRFEGQENILEDGPTLYDLLPSNKSYYRYMGSLTTPPCSEEVMWSVFTHPVYVAKEKFLDFQSFFQVKQSDLVQTNSTKSLGRSNEDDPVCDLDGVLLHDNYRPTQPYDSANVVVYVDEEVTVAGADTLQIVLWTLAGLILFGGILAMMICCKNSKDTKKESTIYKQVTTTPLDEMGSVEI